MKYPLFSSAAIRTTSVKTRDGGGFSAAMESCTLSEDSPVDPSACRDPEDLSIFGLAVHAKVDIIVSGGEDLLVLRSFQEIPIRSPRQFWESEKNKDSLLPRQTEPATSKKVHDRSPQ